MSFSNKQIYNKKLDDIYREINNQNNKNIDFNKKLVHLITEIDELVDIKKKLKDKLLTNLKFPSSTNTTFRIPKPVSSSPSKIIAPDNSIHTIPNIITIVPAISDNGSYVKQARDSVTEAINSNYNLMDFLEQNQNNFINENDIKYKSTISSITQAEEAINNLYLINPNDYNKEMLDNIKSVVLITKNATYKNNNILQKYNEINGKLFKILGMIKKYNNTPSGGRKRKTRKSKSKKRQNNRKKRRQTYKK